MSRNRRRHPPARPRTSYRPAQAEAPAEALAGPSLLPTILWGIAGLISLAVLVLLLAVTLPHGFPPRGARAFIGAVILLTVVTIALGAKSLESYLSWREKRAAMA